jgi:uncharacterized protein involved in exopolysaccharide biosynthesis
MATSTHTDADDISIVELIRVVLRRKFIILGIILIALIGTFTYNQLTAPLYQSKVSFFLATPNATPSALSSYTKLLGGSSGDIENYIEAIIESKKIKSNVTNSIKTTLPNANSPLKLHKNLQFKKNKLGIFEIKFKHTNPEVTKMVVDEYVNNISLLNQQLNLSAKKDLITILDESSFPKEPKYPKKGFNLILAFILSTAFGLGFVFIYDYIATLLAKV